MDTIDGIPALIGTDPMSTVAGYSQDLRTALSPVAGRREGLPDGEATIPGGLTRLSLGSFSFQYGNIGPSAGGGITVGPKGVYLISAGVRLGADASSEMQLRLSALGGVGRLGINSIAGARHIACSSGPVLLPAGTDIELELYNNGSSNSADTFFSELPYLSAYLLHYID